MLDRAASLGWLQRLGYAYSLAVFLGACTMAVSHHRDSSALRDREPSSSRRAPAQATPASDSASDSDSTPGSSASGVFARRSRSS